MQNGYPLWICRQHLQRRSVIASAPRKAVNGVYRCRYTPFYYAGTLDNLGTPFGRAKGCAHRMPKMYETQAFR